MKKKILLVLNVPPPYGGGEIQSQCVYLFLNNDSDFIIYMYSRNRSSKKTQGKIIFSNFSFGIKFVCGVCHKLAKHRPQKLFIALPKDFISFIKNSIIIFFSRFINVQVYGELAGASFPFLEAKKSLKSYYGFFVLRKIKSIRLLGPNIQDFFRTLNIVNTLVFSNGVYVPPKTILKKNLYHNQINILYVGAINYSKGIKNMIMALNECITSGMNIESHIIGEWSSDEQKKEILRLINILGLENHITFYGLITDERKWDIFLNCQILVHPTNWDGQPLTILEAMGMGLGVISTKIGAIPNTVINQRNGIILEENTYKNLANAIKLFYDDREFLNYVSHNNISDFRKKYSLELFLNNFKSWLEDKPLLLSISED